MVVVTFGAAYNVIDAEVVFIMLAVFWQFFGLTFNEVWIVDLKFATCLLLEHSAHLIFVTGMTWSPYFLIRYILGIINFFSF